MAKIIMENGILKGITIEEAEEIIAEPDKPPSLVLPESIKRYGYKCFENTYWDFLNLPYRKTLELGVTLHTYVNTLMLRMEDGTNLKFDLSDIKTKPVVTVLQVLRTEEFRISSSLKIRGPIAVYLAYKNKNEDALNFISGKNASSIAKDFIAIEDYESLENMFKLNVLKKVQAETIIKYAITKEKPEAVVMITQYKHEHFQKNVKDRFSL